ncbi:hypothetical protein GWC77_01170 [Paraburkholderia sp. NMBU_R16]|uniref:hypothetical protein n=1 Tax=Paraburkholderia sp. NMBU_R16 TaxID=2698676 RepID=UPI001565D91F|nr:hypothetical protein [Paraburkholderia sp. NMBU_R16]NRO94554.1 hypothetical protein [Paraburkholderia sp. NMBU_R16]
MTSRPAALLFLLAAFVLAACSPPYDWRTVTDDTNGYAIDLPAKPLIDERPIDIAGTAMRMHVRAARAQNAMFSVGTVAMPSDDPKLQRAVLDSMRDALARNVGAKPDAHAIDVPLADGGHVPALELEVNGPVGATGRSKTIHAWLVARGTHVYQAAVIADDAPPKEQTDQFFQSFKVFSR